jgi:hypothetical protein
MLSYKMLNVNERDYDNSNGNKKRMKDRILNHRNLILP